MLDTGKFENLKIRSVLPYKTLSDKTRKSAAPPLDNGFFIQYDKENSHMRGREEYAAVEITESLEG